MTDLDGAIPSAASWIAPYFSELLQRVQDGQSPYLFLLDTVTSLYFPAVPESFQRQLNAMIVLFSLASFLLLAGLLIPVFTGRFWLFHRVDRTITLSNTSAIYGICSLAYTAVGIAIVIAAIRVSRQVGIPAYYVGARAAWIGPLWTGIFCECWATFCAWYIRKNGTFYKENWRKTCLAIVVPLLLPLIAGLPPLVLFYLAASSYNASFRRALDIVGLLEGFQAKWTPAAGFEVNKLTHIIKPGSELGNSLVKYSVYSRAGYAYCAGVLLLTLVVYVVGAYFEIAHLDSTVSELRAEGTIHTHFSRIRRQSYSDLLASPQSAYFAHQARSPRSPDTKTPTRPQTGDSVRPLNEEYRLSAPPSPRSFGSEAASPPWTLLAWARRNRLYSATCIAAMLLVNAALELWQALTPLSFDRLEYPSGQWQVEILVSCWLNGLLTTLVSLLLLFRSLDGSSPTVSTLQRLLPFLPLPPPVAAVTVKSQLTEPPRFAAYDVGGMPLVERVEVLEEK
ncbi:hypothetical protein JCM8097_003996 [Rhodosporidiobolus ruineniae]